MNVELINVYGNDLSIVNAARVSYGKQKDVIDDSDIKLIKYLKNHGHTSPFRHAFLQFRIECPIFVERQLFKHQIGLSANSISGRYVDFSDKYHTIKQLRLQSNDSKQGSGDDMDRPDLVERMNSHIEESASLYRELCDAGVAKEQARVILPLALETQFIWSGSLQAFLHLWDLRLKSDSQLETREISAMMLEQVANIEGQPFKHTLEAWGYERI